MLSDNHCSLSLTSANSQIPDCNWLGSTRCEICDVDRHCFIIHVVSNMPSDRKLFDNKEELNDKIEACLRIMDLPDELKEPKWYPIF